jgi:carbamoyl-phosphate synthase large subunit
LLTELEIPFHSLELLKLQMKLLLDVLDFPLLIRPSYVLGGQGMKIVINKQN